MSSASCLDLDDTDVIDTELADHVDADCTLFDRSLSNSNYLREHIEDHYIGEILVGIVDENTVAIGDRITSSLTGDDIKPGLTPLPLETIDYCDLIEYSNGFWQRQCFKSIGSIGELLTDEFSYIDHHEDDHLEITLFDSDGDGDIDQYLGHIDGILYDEAVDSEGFGFLRHRTQFFESTGISEPNESIDCVYQQSEITTLFGPENSAKQILRILGPSECKKEGKVIEDNMTTHILTKQKFPDATSWGCAESRGEDGEPIR